MFRSETFFRWIDPMPHVCWGGLRGVSVCSLNLVILVCGLECWGLPSESFESFRRDSMALQGFHMKIAAITGDSSLHSCLVRADRLALLLFLSPAGMITPIKSCNVVSPGCHKQRPFRDGLHPEEW